MNEVTRAVRTPASSPSQRGVQDQEKGKFSKLSVDLAGASSAHTVKGLVQTPSSALQASTFASTVLVAEGESKGGSATSTPKTFEYRVLGDRSLINQEADVEIEKVDSELAGAIAKEESAHGEFAQNLRAQIEEKEKEITQLNSQKSQLNDELESAENRYNSLSKKVGDLQKLLNQSEGTDIDRNDLIKQRDKAVQEREDTHTGEQALIRKNSGLLNQLNSNITTRQVQIKDLKAKLNKAQADLSAKKTELTVAADAKKLEIRKDQQARINDLERVELGKVAAPFVARYEAKEKAKSEAKIAKAKFKEEGKYYRRNSGKSIDKAALASMKALQEANIVGAPVREKTENEAHTDLVAFLRSNSSQLSQLLEGKNLVIDVPRKHIHPAILNSGASIVSKEVLDAKDKGLKELLAQENKNFKVGFKQKKLQEAAEAEAQRRLNVEEAVKGNEAGTKAATLIQSVFRSSKGYKASVEAKLKSANAALRNLVRKEIKELRAKEIEKMLSARGLGKDVVLQKNLGEYQNKNVLQILFSLVRRFFAWIGISNTVANRINQKQAEESLSNLPPFLIADSNIQFAKLRDKISKLNVLLEQSSGTSDIGTVSMASDAHTVFTSGVRAQDKLGYSDKV